MLENQKILNKGRVFFNMKRNKRTVINTFIQGKIENHKFPETN